MSNLFFGATVACFSIFTSLFSSVNHDLKPVSQTHLEGRYKIVDTGQKKFFDNRSEIQIPSPGNKFYGQDAHFQGNQASYTDNGDGSITDNVTDLIWQKGYQVMSYQEALKYLKNFSLAGESDWRMPDIKEAYSLILFDGIVINPQNSRGGKPFLNTNYFDFDYGSNGRRPIDVQVLTSTVYRGKTMGGHATVFGVNFADGRIKGYPLQDPRSGGGKKFTVRFVRGNPDYGKNNFQDNQDGTISDLATGLMWQKCDSKKGMDWEKSLAWVWGKNKEKYLGYSDWRLPNVKELQSIVDYNRSLQETRSAAINPLFEASTIKDEGNKKNYPFYWSSTTHQNERGVTAASYVCFGEALGFFAPPHSFQSKKLLDVHGAGAQRSDPKSGSASRFPEGRGPQGDVIRIDNYIRMVRDLN